MFPTHGGEVLVRFARGLDAIGPYRIENWAMVPACHLGPDRMWELRERVREIAQSGEVRGIVITHGTDTIEESAYLLDRTLDRKIPVAITGAMRTSSDEGWDGPRNLLDAAAVAASDQSGGRGVMVVFNGKVFAGRTAVKVHATDLDAFAAPHAAPIGRVENGCVVYEPGKRGSAGGAGEATAAQRTVGSSRPRPDGYWRRRGDCWTSPGRRMTAWSSRRSAAATCPRERCPPSAGGSTMENQSCSPAGLPWVR